MIIVVVSILLTALAILCKYKKILTFTNVSTSKSYYFYNYRYIHVQELQREEKTRR